MDVELVSKWIAGERRYTARSGSIHINDTYASGIDKDVTVRIQAADGRDIGLNLTFATRPREKGEPTTESQTERFRCFARSYSFEADPESCQPCEEHAECDGTSALLPEDGYWHSTPFSPVMRRCLTDEACTFVNRAGSLRAYYNDTVGRLERFEELKENAADVSEFLVDYAQCAPGYAGALCGSCEDGYGHTADGGCEECGRSLVVTRVMSTLFVLLITGVVTTKVCVAADDVKKEAEEKLEEEREKSKDTIERETLGNRLGESSTGDVTTASDDGPSTSRLRRGMERSWAIEDPTMRPSKRKRIRLKAKEATGELAATFDV